MNISHVQRDVAASRVRTIKSSVIQNKTLIRHFSSLSDTHPDPEDPSNRTYQYVGDQPLDEALESCQSLPNPGKLPRIYSSTQASHLLTLSPTLSFYVGIQQKEPEGGQQRQACQTPTTASAENVPNIPNCKDCKDFFVLLICETILKVIVISVEFFWSNYTHPQADKVDLDLLIGLFDIDKFKGFQYNPSGALIFKQVQDGGSESFEILSVTESSDAVCELSVGKRDDANVRNIFRRSKLLS